MAARKSTRRMSARRASTSRTEKLKFYVAHLAREADRFEFLLTGKDIH